MKTETAVKERPILFSVPMVRALLAGTKTQTRRIVKQGNSEACGRRGMWSHLKWDVAPDQIFADGKGSGCEYLHVPACNPSDEWDGSQSYRVRPNFEPGLRLWVREPFSAWFSFAHWYEVDRAYRCRERVSNCFYRATHPYPDDDQKWVPSIFMPRWASRITLEITDVRVERIQDIAGKDVNAEGLPFGSDRDFFKTLWGDINGKKSWESNPWVWAISFKRVATAPGPAAGGEG